MKCLLRENDIFDFVDLTEEQLKLIYWLLEQGYFSDWFEITEIEDFKKI